MSVSDKFLRLSVGIHNSTTTIKRFTIGTLVGLLALNPVMALADGDDLAAMVESAATGADTVTTSGQSISKMLGFITVLGSILAMKAKKDNPHIKTWHIALSLVSGILLIVIPQIIKRSQRQLGLQEVDITG